MIEAGHFDAGTAYAAVDRHRLDDMSPLIYRTHDYGRTWTKIISGIGSGCFARAVREDPIRKGLLFVGTEFGVQFSIDDGANWNPLQLNLPVAPIHDLVVKNNDLIVATHGRSFWVLDDISPLRQINAQVDAESAHLFKPANVFRVRRSVNADTPLPPEEPQGQNPPAGALIYYSLAQGAGEVTLEILDSSGQVVRRYSSSDQPRTPRVPPPFPNYWLPKTEILSAQPGMHRFAWDVRYAPPRGGGGYAMAVANLETESLPQGPLVVPGNYRARLTVAGKTYEQPLQVAPDPRVKATPQMWFQQFTLGKRIYDALERAGSVLRQIDQRRAELKQQPNPDLDRKLVELAGAARGEEEEGAPAASGVTLRQVSMSLSHLLGVIESADAAPTKQAADSAQASLKQLDTLLSQASVLGMKP